MRIRKAGAMPSRHDDDNINTKLQRTDGSIRISSRHVVLYLSFASLNNQS
jgi:hypothetical protein